MRKNQKDALLLLKKIGRCSQLDFTMRGIPMSAVSALIVKGLATRTCTMSSEYVLTEAGERA